MHDYQSLKYIQYYRNNYSYQQYWYTFDCILHYCYHIHWCLIIYEYNYILYQHTNTSSVIQAKFIATVTVTQIRSYSITAYLITFISTVTSTLIVICLNPLLIHNVANIYQYNFFHYYVVYIHFDRNNDSYPQH